MNIQQIKKNRFLFLELVYKICNENYNGLINMWELGRQLHFSDDETEKIVDYLIGENLIEAAGLGGYIDITHYGTKEVEEAMENPDKSTEHFLPINIIHIGSMNNSAIQQGSLGSTMSFEYKNSDSFSLDQIIESVEAIKETLSLSIDIQRELISEIETLKQQKASPKPKSIIISESLKTIRNILEGVIGSAVAPGIIEQIKTLLNQNGS